MNIDKKDLALEVMLFQISGTPSKKLQNYIYQICSLKIRKFRDNCKSEEELYDLMMDTYEQIFPKIQRQTTDLEKSMFSYICTAVEFKAMDLLEIRKNRYKKLTQIHDNIEAKTFSQFQVVNRN